MLRPSQSKRSKCQQCPSQQLEVEQQPWPQPQTRSQLLKQPRQSKQPARTQPLLSDTLSAAKGRKPPTTRSFQQLQPTHTTNHSESDDEIFALEEKCSTTNNDQDTITKQDNILEIVIGVLADNIAKQYMYLWALIDSGSSSSIICKSSMPNPIKKKIKDDPSGETKWTTIGWTYITTREANIWFQLTEFAPSCLFKHTFKVDRNAKNASYNIILGHDAMKELQFDLLCSENIPKIQFKQEVEMDCKPCGFWSPHPHLHQVHFQTQQSTSYWKGRRRIHWETMLLPSTVSSSRSSQILTYSFVITRKGETLWPTWQTSIPFQRHPWTPTHQTCPCWNQIQCQAFPWTCILCSKSLWKHDTQWGWMPLPPQCPSLVQWIWMGCTVFQNSQEKWSDSIHLRLPPT